MENFEFEIPEEVREKLQHPESFQQHIEGKSFQEILEFSDEQMEVFYNQASNLYQHHHFQEAIQAFTFLTTLNPFVVNFWIGLGMAEQRIEEYGNALLAYAMAMMVDSKNPLPHYQTALCYRALMQPEDALGYLELALLHCKGEEWAHVKERATLLKSRIIEEGRG